MRVDAVLKIFFNLFTINILLVCLLFYSESRAVDFEREADKSEWIKEFFAHRQLKLYSISLDRNAPPARKKLAEELLPVFLQQKNIEHIEPIARGNDINAPEIAKFNTACPDKRPITLVRDPGLLGLLEGEDPSTFTQEDWDGWGVPAQCFKDMKVFKLDIKTNHEIKEQYILYCEKFINLMMLEMGLTTEEKKEEPNAYEARYLEFTPSHCVYPNVIIYRIFPRKENEVGGIFKYKEIYIFYHIREFEDEITVDLTPYLPGSYKLDEFTYSIYTSYSAWCLRRDHCESAVNLFSEIH